MPNQVISLTEDMSYKIWTKAGKAGAIMAVKMGHYIYLTASATKFVEKFNEDLAVKSTMVKLMKYASRHANKGVIPKTARMFILLDVSKCSKIATAEKACEVATIFMHRSSGMHLVC